jgi:membrane-bound lytic murein transglycosylase B
VLLGAAILLATPAVAKPTAAPPKHDAASKPPAKRPPTKRSPVKKRPAAAVMPHATVDGGWGYLIDKLAADGVDRGRVVAVFRDGRMPEFEGLDFGIVRGGEPRSMYGGFLKSASVTQAQRCRALYDAEFRAAEDRFDVPASVVAALLHVETHCGRNTGNALVFARLARLAMANDPANLQRNLARHCKGIPPALRGDVERRVHVRAHELESVFYPEVLAMFGMVDRTGMDPLSVRGSGSGAFGFPQFLPSSYLRFGVDGNDDGRVSLYDPADAIASAANYLAHHGWRPGIGRAQQRQVIWAYNHSDPYIDTVLALAEALELSQPSRLSLVERSSVVGP